VSRAPCQIAGIAVALFCLMGAGAGQGRAAEEHEWQVGFEGLYGLIDVDGRTPSGGGGAVQLTYGFTDALSIQLTGAATGYPLSPLPAQMLLGGTLSAYAVTAGVVYSLDVVRVVPFFEAGVGLSGFSQASTTKGTSTTLAFAATLGLGADYLINRRVAVGLSVRYYAFLTDLTHVPIFLTLGPRVTLRFGR
jgi:outer membrane protein W